MRLGSYIPPVRQIIGQHTAGLLRTAPGRYLMAQQPGFVRAATNLATIAQELATEHSVQLARTLVQNNFLNPHRFNPDSIPLTEVKENHFSVLLPHEVRDAAQKTCQTLNDLGWNIRYVSNLFVIRSTPSPLRSTRSAGDIQRERQEIVQSMISYLGDAGRTRPILKEELLQYVTGKFPDVTQQLMTSILNEHRVVNVHEPGDPEPDDATFMAVLTRREETDREQLGYFHKSLWRKFRHDLVRVAGLSKGRDPKPRLTDHWEYFAGGFRSELEASSQWAKVSSLSKGDLWVRRETLRRLIARGVVVRVLGGDHDRFIPREDLYEHSQNGSMMIGSERGRDVGVVGDSTPHLNLVFEYRLPDLKQQVDSVWEQARLGLSPETQGELDVIYQKARDLAIAKGRWSQTVFGRIRFAFEHVVEVVELVHQLNGDAYEILAALLHMVPRDALTRELRDISLPILNEDNRVIRSEPMHMKHFLDQLKLFLFQGYNPSYEDRFYLEKMMGFSLHCLTNESLRRVGLAAHAAPLMNRVPIATSTSIEDDQVLHYSDTFLAAFAEGSQYFIPQLRKLLFWLTEVPYMLLHRRRYIQAFKGIEQATKMTRIDIEKKLHAVGTELETFLNERLAGYGITVAVSDRAKTISSADRKIGRFDRHSESVYRSFDEQRDLGGLYVIDEAAKNPAEERMHLDLIVPLCMEFCAQNGWPAIAKPTKFEIDVRSLEFTIADDQGHLPTEIQAMGRFTHDALQMYGDVAHYFYKGKINFKVDVRQSARWIESLSPGASPFFYYFVPRPEYPWGDMWILEEPIEGSPLLLICNRVLSDWIRDNPYADGFQGFDVYWLHPDEKVNLERFDGTGHPQIEPVLGVADTQSFSKHWDEVRRPDPPIRKNPLLAPVSGPKRIPIVVPVFRKGIPAIHQTTQGVKHLNRDVDSLIAHAKASNGGLLDFHHPLAPNPRAILMARTGGGVQDHIAQAARKADETQFLEKLIPPGIKGRDKLPEAVRQLGFRDVNELKAFVGAILIRIENLKKKDAVERTTEYEILEAMQNAILAECNIPAIPGITVGNGQVTVYFPQVPDRIGLLNRLLSQWQHPILAVRLHTTARYRKPQFLASITFSYPTAVAGGPVPREFDNVHEQVQELMKGTSTPVRVPVDASHPVEMNYNNLTAPDMRELRRRLQSLSDLNINVTSIIVKGKESGLKGNGILYEIELTFPTRESLEKYSSEVENILSLSPARNLPPQASSL